MTNTERDYEAVLVEYEKELVKDRLPSLVRRYQRILWMKKWAENELDRLIKELDAYKEGLK